MLAQFIGHGRLRELGDSPGIVESRVYHEPKESKAPRMWRVSGSSLDVLAHKRRNALILTFAQVSGTLFAIRVTCLRSLSCVDSVGFLC